MKLKIISGKSRVFVESKSNWDPNYTFQISEEPIGNTGKINGISSR